MSIQAQQRNRCSEQEMRVWPVQYCLGILYSRDKMVCVLQRLPLKAQQLPYLYALMSHCTVMMQQGVWIPLAMAQSAMG